MCLIFTSGDVDVKNAITNVKESACINIEAAECLPLFCGCFMPYTVMRLQSDVTQRNITRVLSSSPDISVDSVFNDIKAHY